MPKLQRKIQSPKCGGVCPNPQCRSKYFPSLKKLQSHIGAKPSCLAYLQSLREKIISSPSQLKALEISLNNNVTENSELTSMALEMFPPPVNNPNVIQDCVSTNSTSDFEHINFSMLNDDEEEDFIINPEPAVFSNNRHVEIILMKILTELEAPLWAFKVIMDWASDAHATGYNFKPEQKSYKSQITMLEKWVCMDHMRPNVVSVQLPGKRTDDFINVTTFDFIGQFHSLLSDPLLNTAENLVVNSTDPFSKYTPPDGLLSESLSGSWYQHAWDHMEMNTNCNFMIPIILYIDKTMMSLSGKLSLTPVQMSLSIFTEEARRKVQAWRPLGYIANEEFFFTGRKKRQ